ncbi:zf-HC2 domain-containing protein [Streptomyces sp. NPDC088249]|uniref:zf-HC2 domain-containing protein n=1 Tax=Streptomyces sp. NPDC088249 TaxID=3365843 RepID=UPI0037FC1EFE
MLTATEKYRTIGERPADDHGLKAPAADEASTVGTHLETCPTCRDEHDCGAALPVHLFLLRDALAASTGRHRGTPEHRHAAPCRRGPARADGATQLTLSQWVSRTARIGDGS